MQKVFYKKAINKEDCEKIKDLFYKQQALQQIHNNVIANFNSLNPQAFSIITDKLACVTKDLEIAKDDIEKVALGDLYRTFDYKYEILFHENSIKLIVPNTLGSIFYNKLEANYGFM